MKQFFPLLFFTVFIGIKIVKAISPNSVVTTTQIGLAMINSIDNGYSKKVLAPKDIISLSDF